MTAHNLTAPQAATTGAELPADIAAKLVSPDVWADENGIYPVLSWIRENNPLGMAAPEGFEPFWVASKHADILEISRQNAQFHSGDKSAVLLSAETFEMLAKGADGREPAHRSIVFMDPPEHGRYRALTQMWFQPKNVRTREARIREIAQRAVERLREGDGQCDFMKDIASYFPLEVIMEILGVPADHFDKILKITQEVFSSSDEDLGRKGENTLSIGSDQVYRDSNAFFQPFHEDRKINPCDDVLSVIANGKINGEPVPDLEALSYYNVVATAGHDTTASSTAAAIWALAQNPEMLRELQEDPSKIPALVEEAIRWTTPVRHFMRSATSDYEMRGRTIREGDWIMLCYPSGNRDEEVFDHADEFRIDRKSNPQLAFGYGGHMCLGQHLARLEMRVLLEELIPRFQTLKLDGKPAYTKAVFVGGLKSLPISYVLD